jgi:uncharacterized protein
MESLPSDTITSNISSGFIKYPKAVREMADYPESYIAYLIEYHATRDYFECHELLEEYWKSLPKDAANRGLWVGLIQIAVAQYHHRRGNARGAVMMFRQAASRIDAQGACMVGLDAVELHRLLQERISSLETKGDAASFVEFDLPIADTVLLGTCVAICRKRGHTWGAPSNMTDRPLIHRHMLRDRSDVVAARAESAALKHRRL